MFIEDKVTCIVECNNPSYKYYYYVLGSILNLSHMLSFIPHSNTIATTIILIL